MNANNYLCLSLDDEKLKHCKRLKWAFNGFNHALCSPGVKRISHNITHFLYDFLAYQVLMYNFREKVSHNFN